MDPGQGMDDSFGRKRRSPEAEPAGNAGEEVEFLSSGGHDVSGTAKKTLLYDLRTGKPFEIPVKDQFGSCRFVSEFEKLNRVGEGTYGIVYRARDTKSGKFRIRHQTFLAKHFYCYCNILPY